MKRSLWWTLCLSVVAALTVLAASQTPNLPQAIAAQQQLAEDRPGDPAVYNDLGNLLRLAHRMEEAKAAYVRAIELDPARVSARFNLALLLQEEGHLTAALRELKEVTKRTPDHAWAHYQAGAVLDSKGMTAAAVQAYARAFALDPELAFPEVNPHVIENQLLTEALLVSQRHAAMRPQAPNAYENPGRIAALLIPPVSGGPAAAPADPAERQAAAGLEAGTPEPGAGARQPAKSLSREDLEPGAQGGQAVMQRRVTQPRGGERGERTRFGVSRQAPMAGGGAAVADPQGRAITPPAAPGSRPDAGSRFRPGAGSTGRLDLRLLPAERPAPERAG